MLIRHGVLERTLITIKIEGALITSLADDDELTRDDIKNYAIIAAAQYDLDETIVEQIIENVASKLIA